MDKINYHEPQTGQNLFFDPETHPENVHKAFIEFIQQFELRYQAQFPDPPKVSLDSAITRWKIEHTTEAVANPTPNLAQYDAIRNDWQSKDKVSKMLGMFSSSRLYSDWKAAEPDQAARDNPTWENFKTKMKEYYKPSENPTLKNYKFREMMQGNNETFPGYCNRVKREAKHCNFKCAHADCTAEDTAIRDPIVIYTMNYDIREDALQKSWNLNTLYNEGMKLESA